MVAGLAFTHQDRAGGNLFPAADRHHLPQLRIREAAKEAHRAQRVELLAVGEFLGLSRQALRLEGFGQVLGEILPGLVAPGLVLLHGLAHDPVDRHGDAFAQRGRRRGVGGRDLVDHAEVVRGLVGQLAGQQLVHHHAQRVDVGLLVERLLADLLGGHVGGRADPGHMGGIGSGGQGKPEVGDLDVGRPGHQDVPGLDVPVRDADLVGVGQGPRALEDNLDDLVDRQQVVRRGARLERPAGHELHDDVAGIVLDHRVVDRHDVRMRELAGERRLGEEELPVDASAGAVAQRLREDPLDRNLTVVERVAAEVHLAGRPFAELPDDRVLPDSLGQGGRLRVGRVRGHGGGRPIRPKAGCWPWSAARPGFP